jgi:hypothetical protein
MSESSLQDAHVKTHARVQKLVTLAGRTTNEHERRLAARKACEYLDAHPAPLRWKVPVGTPVRVIAEQYYTNGNTIRGAQLKKSHARGDNWFFEAHRVKGEDAARSLALGWLMFQRLHMVVFVDAGKVEVYL